MAEKSNKPSNVGGKNVPMRLFAAWEVDRTPPNCIPRLCTLNLTRLLLLKRVGGDISSVILAVKMQSSKRTLRSNEIMVPSNGLIDTELDLTFSLQYPHFLKRSGNHLQIMLQRRKRYKNRAILGFKTLAGGVINMGEVLQRPMDKELELHTNSKEKSEVIAKVMMIALSSQPVDHEDADRRKLLRGIERVVEVDNFSDEEEEYTSNEEGCDSEPVAEDSGVHIHSADALDHRRSHLRKSLNQKTFHNTEDRPDPAERNIKQKFIALLKKFRIPEAEVSDSEQYQEELEQELISQNPQEFEDLIDELESMTDSGPDVDDISISSTPKPSLRPFFSSGTLAAIDRINTPLINEDCVKKNDDNHESGTDQENTDTSQTASSPPKSLTVEDKKLLISSASSDKEKKSRLFAREKNSSSSKEKRSPNVKENKEKLLCEKSASRDSECSPQKTVLEQLSRIFPSDDSIPSYILLVSAIDVVGNCLANQLSDREENIITVISSSDLRASFSCLINKIQKFCNCNSRAPQTIKIGILGLDSFISSVLRLYVEHFSSKPFEWQTYVKFYIIPLGVSSVAKYLSNVDVAYGTQFTEGSWKDLLDHCSESTTTPEIQEAVDRILNYIASGTFLWQVAIAEAMVTYKEKSSDEESSQIFIPFITDVKIGMMEGTVQTTSVDLEEQMSINLAIPGSSPPASCTEKVPRENTTPPSSPSISSSLLASSSPAAQTNPFPGETMDLQLDYWILTPKMEAGKKTETSKLTLKTTFRTLHVSRVSNQSESGTSSLTLSYITKEKKQKIMRLGKKKEKEKEPDNRYQQVEGIHRLICSCRAPQAPLKVTIDGVEWSGVKFFQLTSQWQTHIKYFPVALSSVQEHIS